MAPFIKKIEIQVDYAEPSTSNYPHKKTKKFYF